MDIVDELRAEASFAHGVTGCSIKRHTATRAANEIEFLRDWIQAHGEQTDTCTRGVLGTICGGCECGKAKMPNAAISGAKHLIDCPVIGLE